jgi:hypothetical protein
MYQAVLALLFTSAPAQDEGAAQEGARREMVLPAAP